MEARDVMVKDVVTLEPDLPIAEAADVLLRYRIHGAPVVDSSGALLGMVSVVDLVGRVGETVADVMSADPVVAAEDTPVEEVARLMLDQMVRRVPIVRAGRVVGIISASDIIQLFLNLHEQPAGRSRA
ncbi:MAG: CBS domain-containing protein [Armatimonadota bacterium]|nr:CBS domain-containing protein [Armatimonadota bacterium]